VQIGGKEDDQGPERESTTDPGHAIDSLDTGKRGGPEPSDITLATFGIPIPEA
jgi:hypothetical protein